MTARIVSRIFFAIGMLSITAAPFVPMIYRWFNPPRTPRPDPRGFWETLGLVLESLNSFADRKSTRLNSSHTDISRMPSSA